MPSSPVQDQGHSTGKAPPPHRRTLICYLINLIFILLLLFALESSSHWGWVREAKAQEETSDSAKALEDALKRLGLHRKSIPGSKEFLEPKYNRYAGAFNKECIASGKYLAPIGDYKDGKTYGDYRVIVYRTFRGEGSFEIRRAGKQIFSCSGTLFTIGYNPDDGEQENPLIKMGRDITGDGEPNLVVGQWTGGMHCCFEVYVFSIGRVFKPLFVMDTGSGNWEFKDLDGDGILEILTRDMAYAYWRTSFSESPKPLLVLKFDGTAYRIATKLMRKPPPSRDELILKASEVARRWDDSAELPPELWGYMLDLIYTGYPVYALRFFDLAWPSGLPGKENFLRALVAEMKRSRFWPELSLSYWPELKEAPVEHLKSLPAIQAFRETAARTF